MGGQAITCILHAGANIVFAFNMIYYEMLFSATSLDLTIIHTFCALRCLFRTLRWSK